ncbi:MAG: TIGR00725 family protein [Promethearchaeota archaeon]|jgi:hypothetical protein|nr:MAG: TIGR00725 family protein [Candidatus Lokiarchaeota archaeon]
MKFNFKKEIKATVSVIGTSEIDQSTQQMVIKLGELLAKNRYAIACGGLSGVMEAICRGAKGAGGLTIGIIPYKEKSLANEFIDIVIPVPFSQARNVVVVLAGDACIAVGGKAGTLSEMCFAWIYGKPIIAFSNIEGWSSKLASYKIDNRRDDVIHEAKSPEEVLKKLNLLIENKKLKYRIPEGNF